MKNRRGIASLIATAAVLTLIAAGCGSSGGSDSSGDKTTTTEKAAANTDGLSKLNGKLDGQGSSFQDTFQQKVSTGFDAAVKDAGGSTTVTYTKTGSSDGKKALADGTVDYAGTDSAIKDDEKAAFGSTEVLYFPVVGGPIAVAFNLKGVDSLNLSPDTIAGIFQGDITTWDDAAIKKDNPDATLPSTKITVVHRSDGSGTTSNFTKFLVAAAPDTWKLDSGETVEWPASTQGAEKSTGVTSVVAGTDGAIGYADLADAAKADLSVASVGNASGDFIAPNPDSASAALAGAEINDDLTYNPLNVDADGAYPITSPTWMLVDKVQKDAATAAVLKAYLNYVLTTGQDDAKGLLYAPLPEDLATKAIAQIDDITVG
ncbi:phosphate ABC transporter substrate-binding protein PstS [Aquihabitans sp. McL0605]|uniref:phosphate ABC transporter substrate-binding protein PstS n=1 Tax=Aquihabitans sp. McL0605 TaxID=3415671 RepID=UPI003CEA9028